MGPVPAIGKPAGAPSDLTGPAAGTRPPWGRRGAAKPEHARSIRWCSDGHAKLQDGKGRQPFRPSRNDFNHCVEHIVVALYALAMLFGSPEQSLPRHDIHPVIPGRLVRAEPRNDQTGMIFVPVLFLTVAPTLAIRLHRPASVEGRAREASQCGGRHGPAAGLAPLLIAGGRSWPAPGPLKQTVREEAPRLFLHQHTIEPGCPTRHPRSTHRLAAPAAGPQALAFGTLAASLVRLAPVARPC